MGSWPRFHGRATHDRWASYDAYTACAHSLCGAHLLRELTLVAEQDGQGWAGELADLRRAMCAAAHEWRAQGASSLPVAERAPWIAQSHGVLAHGFAAQPPPAIPAQPAAAVARRRRGRPKQSPAKNLLDALLQQRERVLAFVDDLSIPFTNNQAERDRRMAKVQQKVAGTFRSDGGDGSDGSDGGDGSDGSDGGATAYCRLRSYLSTMRKQGHGMLDALVAVFAGHPLPIAWGS